MIPADFRRRKLWHVVYVHSKAEFRVQIGLRAIGFETYLPVEKRWIKHARKKEIRERPLFSRYLFVSFDPEKDNWMGPIVTTDGVIQVLAHPQLMQNGYDIAWIPISVPEAEIIRLKRKEAAGDFDYSKRTCAFVPGQSVRIAEGPFAGLEAIVESTSDNKKVEILLNLLNRKTVVKLEASELEKI